MKRLLPILALAACGDYTSPESSSHRLGMNDVSMLLPLPADPSAPTLLSMTSARPLVPEVLVNRQVFLNGIGPKNQLPVAYADFHVVAIRFDLCRRLGAGPCPDEDGRLRLVLQPMFVGTEGTTISHDIALHAFYPIPEAELASVVSELRSLGGLVDLPEDAPLDVDPGLVDPIYTGRLRELVLRYASEDRLVKLTVIGQNAESAAFAWVMSGCQLADDGSCVSLSIPNFSATTFKQSLHVFGGDVAYEATPIIDAPPGFTLTLTGDAFAASSPDDQRFGLEALAAIQNPDIHQPGDVQCIACHVSTILTARRTAAAGIDPLALENRYQSPYNTAVSSIASIDPRVVRAFGWAGSTPAISQRVANDTAQVLLEIEDRFPVASSP